MASDPMSTRSSYLSRASPPGDSRPSSRSRRSSLPGASTCGRRLGGRAREDSVSPGEGLPLSMKRDGWLIGEVSAVSGWRGPTSGRGQGGAEVPRRDVTSRGPLSRLCSACSLFGVSPTTPAIPGARSRGSSERSARRPGCRAEAVEARRGHDRSSPREEIMRGTLCLAASRRRSGVGVVANASPQGGRRWNPRGVVAARCSGYR